MEIHGHYDHRHGPELGTRWDRLRSLDVAVMHAVRKLTRKSHALGMALSVGPEPTKRRFADMPPGAMTATSDRRDVLQEAYLKDPNTRFHVWIQDKAGWHFHESGTLDDVLQMSPQRLARSKCNRSARLGALGWKKWTAIGLGAVAVAGLGAWLGMGSPAGSRYS